MGADHSSNAAASHLSAQNACRTSETTREISGNSAKPSTNGQNNKNDERIGVRCIGIRNIAGLGLEKDAAERISSTRGKYEPGKKEPRVGVRGAPGVKRG